MENKLLHTASFIWCPQKFVWNSLGKANSLLPIGFPGDAAVSANEKATLDKREASYQTTIQVWVWAPREDTVLLAQY